MRKCTAYTVDEFGEWVCPHVMLLILQSHFIIVKFTHVSTIKVITPEANCGLKAVLFPSEIVSSLMPKIKGVYSKASLNRPTMAPNLSGPFIGMIC